MGKFVSDISDAEFDKEVLQSELPVLVDFWAPWCGPCVALSPTIEEVAGEFVGKIKVVKVNVVDNQRQAASYNVRGIPNLLLFRAGKVVEQRVGGLSKEDLRNFLHPYSI